MQSRFILICQNENKFSTGNVEKYNTDLTKTKSLLAKAKVNGLKLKLAYTANNVPQQKQAAIIQQNLSAAGIRVELVGMDSTALTENLKKHNGKFDMYFKRIYNGNRS